MEHDQLSLEPRLALLAALVPEGARLADIGTDHGYLPVSLLQRGVIPSAIASDINADPLAHARRTAAQYGVSDRIAFRLCAGLDEIAPEEADVIAIAGMGGENIITILRNAPWAIEKTLLLQPMTKAELLRPWLVASGCRIETEHLVRDKGALYTVLTVIKGEQGALSAGQRYCGVMRPEEPLYGDYAQQRIDKLERAAAGLKNAKLTDKAERIAALERIADELRQSKKEWEDGNG